MKNYTANTIISAFKNLHAINNAIELLEKKFNDIEFTEKEFKACPESNYCSSINTLVKHGIVKVARSESCVSYPDFPALDGVKIMPMAQFKELPKTVREAYEALPNFSIEKVKTPAKGFRRNFYKYCPVAGDAYIKEVTERYNAYLKDKLSKAKQAVAEIEKEIG